jgi:hypothetical protein
MSVCLIFGTKLQHFVQGHITNDSKVLQIPSHSKTSHVPVEGKILIKTNLSGSGKL